MRPQDHPAYKMIEAYTRADPVPCAGCTACCRGDQSVEIKREYGDDLTAYPRTHAEWLGDHVGQVLDRTAAGDCIHLGAGGCTIHDRRPLVCRGFDCRRNVLAFPPAQRAEAVRRRLFPSGVFEAGEARLSSVRLQPGEEAILDGLGDHVMARREAAKP